MLLHPWEAFGLFRISHFVFQPSIKAELARGIVQASGLPADGAAVSETVVQLREDAPEKVAPEPLLLYVLGGGSCLIRNFGMYDPEKVTINSDIHANAKGFEYLANERIRKRGVPA